MERHGASNHSSQINLRNLLLGKKKTTFFWCSVRKLDSKHNSQDFFSARFFKQTSKHCVLRNVVIGALLASFSVFLGRRDIRTNSHVFGRWMLRCYGQSRSFGSIWVLSSTSQDLTSRNSSKTRVVADRVKQIPSKWLKLLVARETDLFQGVTGLQPRLLMILHRL